MGLKLRNVLGGGLIGGAMGASIGALSGLGGSQTRDQTSTQTQSPWGPQQPFLLSGFNRASDLVKTPWNVGYDPLQTQGQEGLLNYSQGPAFTSAADQYGQGANFLTSTDLLDPSSNPYLAQSAEAAIRPVTQALTEQWLPNVRSDAILNRGYGGDRQGIAEGIALRGAAQSAGDVSSRMFSDAYQRGLSTIGNNLGQIPQAFNFGSLPYQTQQDIGGQRQEQRLFEQQAPWQQLQNYQNIVGGQYGGTTTTTNPLYRNKGAGMLGGALGGAKLGSMISPGWGTAIGAIGGGLLGAQR